MIELRKATVEDAPAIARVHVRAWQTAYRGLMDDAYLDRLDPDERAAGWARNLGRPRDQDPVFVAERAGTLVGFAVVGPAGDPAGAGELHVINVDPDHWRAGVGAALLAAAERTLADLGFVEAVLWVMPGNDRARRFYEAAGWTAEGATRTIEVHGITIPEVRYRRDLG